MVVGEAFGFNDTSDAKDNVSQVEWDRIAYACPVGTMEVLTFVGDGIAHSLGETDQGGFDLSHFSQGLTFVIP